MKGDIVGVKELKIGDVVTEMGHDSKAFSHITVSEINDTESGTVVHLSRPYLACDGITTFYGVDELALPLTSRRSFKRVGKSLLYSRRNSK